MKMRKFFALAAILLGGCLSEPLPPLRGTMWRPPEVPPYIYLDFTADGRLVGGINADRFFAPIVLDEEKQTLRIYPLAIRHARNSDPELEKRLREALKRVRSYRINGQYLILYGEKAEPVLRLYSTFPEGRYPEDPDNVTF